MIDKGTNYSRRLLPMSFGVFVRGSRKEVVLGLSPNELENDVHYSSIITGQPLSDVESGLQMHCFTNRRTLLVTKIEENSLCSKGYKLIENTIKLNCSIWKESINKEISTPGNFILLSESSALKDKKFSKSKFFYSDTVAGMLRKLNMESGYSIILPSITENIGKIFGCSSLAILGEITTFLNNKNLVIPFLQSKGINVPCTSIYNHGGAPEEMEGDRGRFVFKAAESAGGVGVHTNNGLGYSSREIASLYNELDRTDKLPRSYQVQKLVKGNVYGIIAIFYHNGTFSIKAIYKQIFDDGEFVGAKWSQQKENMLQPIANTILSKIGSDEGASLLGPINIDMIVDSRGNYWVLEINYRYSGASALSYIKNRLSKSNVITGCKLIEIRTRCNISCDTRSLLKTKRFIEQCKIDNNTLILPLGINPFGFTKIVFVNDRNNLAKEFFCKT